MRRELMIRGAIGLAGAVVLVIVAIANDVTFNLPLVLIIVLAALLPLAKAYGRRKAYQAGRRMRDDH